LPAGLDLAALGRVVVAREDPRVDDVRALLERHVSFARRHSPPEDTHALGTAELLDPAISFFSCRLDGELLAVGGIKRLDAEHAEIKSMHTSEAARRRGLGRAMVDHLIAVAAEAGYTRLSLETGAMEAFAPARSLYAGAGFVECEPFGNYVPSRNSVFMTMALPSGR
jgi:putative acetyltransferase